MTQRRTVQLDEIADLELGKAPPRSSIVPPAAGTALVARPSELGAREPAVESATTKPLRTVRKGDLIVSVRGANFGRVNIADREYALGRGLAAIHPHAVGDGNYLLFALDQARPQLEAITRGTQIPTLRLDQLGRLTIGWPSAERRRKIATSLEAIEELEARTGRYPKLVSDAAESLYDVATSSTNEAALRDRSMTQLDDLVEEVRDRLEPSDLGDRRVAHYSYQAVRTRGEPEIVRGDELGSTKKRVPNGALLVSLLEPSRWIVSRVRIRDDELAVSSPEFLVVVPRDPAASSFIYAALRFDESFRRQIQGSAQGTIPGRERTQAKDALSAQIPLPPIPELRDLSARFDSVFDLEDAATRRAHTSANLAPAAARTLITEASA